MDFNNINVHYMYARAKCRGECIRRGNVGLELGSAVVGKLQHHRTCSQKLLERDRAGLVEGAQVERGRLRVEESWKAISGDGLTPVPAEPQE